jgi:hypothetical protein
MCGEINEEFIVPELFKEIVFVYFSFSTKKEQAQLDVFS